MHIYMTRRFLQIIPVVFVVLTMNFILIHIAPGDPAFILAGPEAPQEYIQEIRERLGLNKPIWEQYVIYITRVLRGDLGTSYRFKQPVVNVITGQVPATLLLTGTAFVTSTIVGVGLGIFCVQVKDSLFDRLSNALAVTFYSIPTFWIGLLLLMVFSVRLRWLPVQGMRTVASGFTGPLALTTWGATCCARWSGGRGPPSAHRSRLWLCRPRSVSRSAR